MEDWRVPDVYGRNEGVGAHHKNRSARLAERSTNSAPKIRLRRSAERGYEDFGWADNWMTFSFAGYRDPAWTNFGPLRVMVENHIQPHSGFPAHPHNDVEILTYVAAGTLTHGDSFGHKAAITAGEMQHISAGGEGMVHSEENLHDIVEHNYQMWLIPEREGTKFAYHQLRYSIPEREGRFRLYASPDGRDGSMPMNADAFVYGALFRPDDSVTHDLADGRGAWVQVVRGNIRVAGLPLEAGDGVGITNAPRVRIECQGNAEVLLFDVRMDAPLLWH